MKIIFIIPFYRRLDLTDLCFAEIKKQGCEVYTVGSEGDKSKQLAEKHDFHYIEFPNVPVSNKHNALTESIRNIDFDYAILIGSDNFVNKDFIKKYSKHLKKYKPLCTQIDSVYFYHVKEKVLSLFTGFTGVARAYSKELLEGCNYRLWKDGINKGLDTSSMGIINSNGYEIDTVSQKELGIEVLDVKYSDSLTNHAIANYGDKNVNISIDLCKFEQLEKYSSKVLRFQKDKKVMKSTIKIEIIKPVAGMEKGLVKPLPAKLANDLINRGIAKVVGKTTKVVTKSKPKTASKPKAKPCQNCDDKPCEDCEKAAETTNIPTRKGDKK